MLELYNVRKGLLLHVVRYSLKGFSTIYAQPNLGTHGKAIKEEIVTKGVVRETELPATNQQPSQWYRPKQSLNSSEVTDRRSDALIDSRVPILGVMMNNWYSNTRTDRFVRFIQCAHLSS